jgi:hypothetical protein
MERRDGEKSERKGKAATARQTADENAGDPANGIGLPLRRSDLPQHPRFGHASHLGGFCWRWRRSIEPHRPLSNMPRPLPPWYWEIVFQRLGNILTHAVAQFGSLRLKLRVALTSSLFPLPKAHGFRSVLTLSGSIPSAEMGSAHRPVDCTLT